MMVNVNGVFFFCREVGIFVENKPPRRSLCYPRSPYDRQDPGRIAVYNIIPATVVIEGTTRALDENVRQKLARRIEEISKHTAEAFGGSADFVMDWGAPPVVNNDEMAAFAADCAKSVLGEGVFVR